MFRNRLIFTLCITFLITALFAKQVSAIATGTVQDFDVLDVGTPYSEGIHVLPPTPTQGPQLVDGGPTDIGKRMRLAFADAPIPTNNSIAFDRTNVGAFDQVVAEFDFRMSPGNGRADGIGFAFLNTADHFTTGSVAPQFPLFAAEEPNFAGSLGVGFDIHKSDSPTEVSNNHLSVHFNGTLVQEFDVTDALDLDLASGQWIHARIIMRPGGGYSDVTVILTQCGRAPITVIDQFKVSSFTPYEGRVYFAARSGFESADQDIDNVHVNFLSLEQGVIAFNNNCYTAVEADGSQLLTITRTGNVNEVATVNYVTTDHLATAPSDYTAISGTLTFNAGETTKTLSVTILDSINNEPDESFLVSLSDPSAGIGLGGPAVAKVTIVDGETARAEGHWSEVIRSEVVPIHMHLLPTGQVMYWDRHNHMLEFDGNPRLWDPSTGTISMAAMTSYDLFCSGHSFLADGRLLVTGGHIEDGVGEDKASIYDPFTDSWTSIPNMNAGRWYPSNVTLSNGDVLVLGGSFQVDPPPELNPLPQIWQISNNSWRDLTSAQISKPPFADYYPFLYMAPNGKVFNAGPQKNTYYLDTSGTGEWTYVDDSSLKYRNYGSSVMYEDGKVLIVGGSEDADEGVWTPTASAEVINLNDSTPVWDSSIEPLHFARRQHNTTLLPDGKVLVTGGSSMAGFDEASGAVLAAEMWDPATETWTVMAAQTRYRGYHSNALLLPDGRVLVGGGGHPPDIGAEYNFEIYSPPYLFKGARPVISNAPELVGYGEEFFIATPDAAAIEDVTLVRLSSVTHSFNQNQRFKRLDFVQTSGGLTATLPDNPNLLPPGHYMLFILNNEGVPSVAEIIRIDSDVNVSIGGKQVGAHLVGASQGIRQSYFLDNGPVKITSPKNTPIIAAIRAIWQESGQRTSYSELMGLPEEQLSGEYWFPWYNNASPTIMDQGFRIANVDSTDVTIKVVVGTTELDSFTLNAGASIRKSYPGVDNGPVRIYSTDNTRKIIAAMRVIWQESGQRTSYSEMMGLPVEQLSGEYWFPWYNNLSTNSMDQGFRIANVDIADTTVKVMIGNTEIDSFTLAAGASMRKNYPVDNGPIRIFSTGDSMGNDVKIIVALRVIWQESGQRTSYSEMMGLPKQQLSNEYWFPWYNNAVTNSMDQGFRIANVNATDQNTIQVWVGNSVTPQDTFTLDVGASIRVEYNVDNGPIRIVCITCSVKEKIIAALRVIWQEPGFRSSYSEMMGLPAELLSTEYWFPWYNNHAINSMDQGFRLSVP